MTLTDHERNRATRPVNVSIDSRVFIKSGWLSGGQILQAKA